MNRVVITGLGAVTPLGNDVESYWNGLKEGRNGIDNITKFDTTEYKTKLAAEVKNFTTDGYIDPKEAKRLDLFSQYAIVASKQAVADSGINLDEIDRTRFGVYVGSGIGGMNTWEEESNKMFENGNKKVSLFFIPMTIGNMAAGNVAIEVGAKGPCLCIVTACATGTQSIGEAFRNIKHGVADLMLAGGTEASITPLGIAGFENLRTLCTSADKNRASMPFDAERSGFVMGEGSGVVLLESLEHAKARGAKIYAEIVGYGSTCDAYHMTAPSPDGEGGARAMEQAINEAGIKKEEIAYINAHGTSTPTNDKTETASLKKLFGDYAYKIPVSSTKSMTGHLLGAAGGIEAIATIKAVQEDFMPPTIGYKVKDEECDLDYIPNVGRDADIKYALSNSLGFGGHNGTILIKKWED